MSKITDPGAEAKPVTTAATTAVAGTSASSSPGARDASAPGNTNSGDVPQVAAATRNVHGRVHCNVHGDAHDNVPCAMSPRPPTPASPVRPVRPRPAANGTPASVNSTHKNVTRPGTKPNPRRPTLQLGSLSGYLRLTLKTCPLSRGA
jgi:hypothetical protein